ncbi:MAG: hypothetical protein AB1437_04640 [Pseudomonadota bacterium]
MKDTIVTPQDHRDPETPVSTDLPAAQAIGSKGAARRRFARTGLAGGVILTLVSKPGMAMTCTTTSGFASGPNASISPGASCSGRSPGYWSRWTGEWEKAGLSTETEFSKVFSCGSTFTVPLATQTLLEVVDQDMGPKHTGKSKGPKTNIDQDNVARHLVAALLNARTGKVPQLPEREVMEIWNSYARTQTYSPKKDVVWNGADIVIYLKSTMK